MGIKSLIAVIMLSVPGMSGCGSGGHYTHAPGGCVSLASLLDEMGNYEADPHFPSPGYTALQLTSYDRRSVVPGTPFWHANDDWSGYERHEANQGRAERVLFDEAGPGVITRIITTGGAGTANLRFYFDNETEASVVIPGFDISKFPVEIPPGLIYMHEHYPTHQGSSFYYPVPYGKRCKITVDDLGRNYVYHVNYRRYTPGTKVKTFSSEEALRLRHKAMDAGRRMENPVRYTDGYLSASEDLPPAGKTALELPGGPHAIRTLTVDVKEYKAEEYAQIMRGLIITLAFDGTETVRVPLSDFSGAGMGAPAVENYYMSADGKGGVSLRFVMPYRKTARVLIENITKFNAGKITLGANVSPWRWRSNTLYFHATWRQENGLETNRGIDYDMATLSGRGVFKADVLSLYNHCPRWYGEGDEHIRVDGESFPSHFGCGTEDYYNTTYAPIHVFHNPFGGAPREDDEASRGYNTFVRVRPLDGIPFREKLEFEFELISWDGGKADYSSTVFWYGDLHSKALTASDDREALYLLPDPVYTGDQ